MTKNTPREITTIRLDDLDVPGEGPKGGAYSLMFGGFTFQSDGSGSGSGDLSLPGSTTEDQRKKKLGGGRTKS